MPWQHQKLVWSDGRSGTFAYWEPFPNAPENMRQDQVFIPDADQGMLDFPAKNPLDNTLSDYEPLDPGKLFPKI